MASNRGGRSFDAKLGASLSKLGGAKRLGGISGGAQRLTSLRPARDLTLGGQPKRTFAPNIPVRRIKEEPEASTSSESQSSRKEQRRGDRNDRSRGRGRGRREVVASASIFSHGPFAGPKTGGFSKSNEVVKDNLSKKAIMGGSKDRDDITDESQKILDMLTDEGRIETEDMKSGSLMPITIPLANSKLLGKKEEGETEDESATSDMDALNEAEKPKISKAKLRSAPRGTSQRGLVTETITCAELFTRKSREDELVFFQFPDALPINTLSTDRVPPSTDQDDKGSTSSLNKETSKTEDLETSLKKFSFQNVSEGYIGKLQIHKSGRVRLLLGNATLDVSMGIPCGFLQDLVSVHTEEGRKEMLSLGHVSHRLVCTPNYDDLLGSLDNFQETEKGQEVS